MRQWLASYPRSGAPCLRRKYTRPRIEVLFPSPEQCDNPKEPPMRGSLNLLLVVPLAFQLAAWSPAEAQFGKFKDKVTKKGEEQVDKAIDKAVDGTDDKESTAKDQEDEKGADEAKGTAAKPGGSATAEDMTLYTKYDFVPGDKVIFFDDLAREEIGEFPSRWGLVDGVFENVKVGTQNWILCTNRGTIYPKIAPGPLPEKYTVEMDFYSNADKDGWYMFQWKDADDQKIGELSIGYSSMTSLWMVNKKLSDKGLEDLPKGRHVLRIMATKSTIKCYIDQERIANVPKVEGFAPVKFAVELNPYYEENKAAMIGTFRYAEGGKTLKEQLDETGRIVTHGILFDSGSDKIKAESYKTLADIGTMLADNPDLRVSIEGHTDSDGADAANMTLSQKRSDSVKAYLVSNYKLDATRLETKGWGESKPMDKNDSPEGKANNRRVELVKL